MKRTKWGKICLILCWNMVVKIRVPSSTFLPSLYFLRIVEIQNIIKSTLIFVKMLGASLTQIWRSNSRNHCKWLIFMKIWKRNMIMLFWNLMKMTKWDPCSIFWKMTCLNFRISGTFSSILSKFCQNLPKTIFFGKYTSPTAKICANRATQNWTFSGVHSKIVTKYRNFGFCWYRRLRNADNSATLTKSTRWSKTPYFSRARTWLSNLPLIFLNFKYSTFPEIKFHGQHQNLTSSFKKWSICCKVAFQAKRQKICTLWRLKFAHHGPSLAIAV